jgi:hypothetical protein
VCAVVRPASEHRSGAPSVVACRIAHGTSGSLSLRVPGARCQMTLWALPA